jgi:phosphate-selective porin
MGLNSSGVERHKEALVDRLSSDRVRDRRWALGSVVFVTIACVATSSFAEPNRTLAEELIEIMHASGSIDDEQYERLLEKAHEEERQRAEGIQEAAREAAATTGAAPAVSSGPEDWKFGWNNGFNLERNDGAFKLKLGGRIQNDWAAIGRDGDLKDVFDKGTGTEFRRARLFFSGTVYEQLYFKAQYDLAGGDSDFKDVYIGLRELGPMGQLQVGHAKEPFSLEEQTSSKYLTFMERSLANVFSPGRNTGFSAQNTLLDKRLLWQVGAFRDADDFGDGFGDNGDYNVGARVSGAPLYRDEGEKVWHLGASYSHQFRSGDFGLRYRQRPESHLADRIVDTRAPGGMDVPTDGIDLMDWETALVWGPAAVQAEYIHAFVDGNQGASDRPDLGGLAGRGAILVPRPQRRLREGRKGLGRDRGPQLVSLPERARDAELHPQPGRRPPHGTRPGPGRKRRHRSDALPDRLLGGAGQGEGNAGSAAEVALDEHLAAQGVHEVLHDGEPKTGAAHVP